LSNLSLLFSEQARSEVRRLEDLVAHTQSPHPFVEDGVIFGEWGWPLRIIQGQQELGRAQVVVNSNAC
jgi:hypothetical protein